METLTKLLYVFQVAMRKNLIPQLFYQMFGYPMIMLSLLLMHSILNTLVVNIDWNQVLYILWF